MNVYVDLLKIGNMLSFKAVYKCLAYIAILNFTASQKHVQMRSDRNFSNLGLIL